MFVGTFELVLDDKGRVVLPAAFRAQLASGGVVTRLGDCLGLWTSEAFEERSRRLIERVRNQEIPNDALRVFAAEAAHVQPDGQGRITLPPRLRSLAGFTRNLVVNGRFDRIEIWDRARWAALAASADELLPEQFDALGD